jgi:uncharacterized BrkB/YihY/UPF0761 family membrane protein
MHRLKELFGAINRFQQRHRVVAVPWAVNKKFSNDQANLLVVALGWYGFTAIYPLLLAVITVFGFIGVASLGHGIVNTLHEFPVIGDQFKPGSGGSELHGSVFGLVVGLVGLLYGAQGVTQTAETAMNRVWNVPQVDRPGFLPRLLHSFVALACIGGAFVINAFLGTVASGAGRALWVSVVLILVQLAVNVVLYLISFRVLLAPAAAVATRSLLPGAVAGGVSFTALITVGAGLVTHQLKHSSATYGAFSSVIGIVTFLLLLSKLTLYAAELNPVLDRKLYPRAMPMCDPLPADDQALAQLVHEERRRPDEHVGVGFEPDAPEEAYQDAKESAAQGSAAGEEGETAVGQQPAPGRP